MSNVPANVNGLAELRALLREMGFEIVPIGHAELLAQALRPLLREEIERALAAVQSSPLSNETIVSVDLYPDGCE